MTLEERREQWRRGYEERLSLRQGPLETTRDRDRYRGRVAAVIELNAMSAHEVAWYFDAMYVWGLLPDLPSP